jgi:hypothetical protein
MAKGRPENGESNMGMVRTALNELGADAKPLELQSHIKSKFGKELPTQIISNYKFTINKKKTSSGSGMPGRRGRKPGITAGGLQVEDFEAIRGLVSRLGPDKVKRLVDVVV